MDALKSVFENDFKFDVSITELRYIGAEPQIQLDTAIANFVRKHDRPDEQHLLIVFYSGHGSVSTERPVHLMIAGPYNKKLGDRAGDDRVHLPQANFSQAARILRDDTASDVLVILDCCHTGAFATDFISSDSDQRYEVMMATGQWETTALPGPRSYAAALIESLKECKSNYEAVTTLKLAQTIKDGQISRGESQSSLHAVLLGRDARHIVLALPVKEKRLLEGDDCMRLRADLYR